MAKSQPNWFQFIIQTVIVTIFGGVIIGQIMSLNSRVGEIEGRLGNIQKNVDVIPNIREQLARMDERQQNAQKILDEVKLDLKKIVPSQVSPIQTPPDSQISPRPSGSPRKNDPGSVIPDGKGGSGPIGPAGKGVSGPVGPAGKVNPTNTPKTPVFMFPLFIVAIVAIIFGIILFVVAQTRKRAKART